MHTRLARRFACLAVPCVALTACGGGGGGSGSDGGGSVSPPPTATTYNFDAAMERIFTLGTSLSASATDSSGAQLTAVYTTTPQADAAFENATRKRTLEAVRLTRAGVTQATDSSTTFYGISPFTIYGSLESDGSYTVATSNGALPSAGTVGQSGTLLSDVTYADATKARVTGRSTVSWSLEAGSGSTAYACVNTAYTTSTGQADGSAAQCFLIGSTGMVSGMRLTLTDASGQSVVFR